MKRREFRAPLAVAWSATLVSVCLALAPGLRGGIYDPTLAVLTATLVSLIWYTYFTYQTGHRRAPVRVALGLDLENIVGGLAFRPRIINASAEPLTISLSFELWVDGVAIPLGRFCAGKDTVVALPGDTTEPRIRLDAAMIGGSAPAILARAEVTWTDAFGNKGSTGSKYWELPSGSSSLTPVIGEQSIADAIAACADLATVRPIESAGSQLRNDP